MEPKMQKPKGSNPVKILRKIIVFCNHFDILQLIFCQLVNYQLPVYFRLG